MVSTEIKRVRVTTPDTRDAMVAQGILEEFTISDTPPFIENSGRVYKVEANVKADDVKGFRREFEARDYGPGTEVIVTEVPEPA